MLAVTQLAPGGVRTSPRKLVVSVRWFKMRGQRRCISHEHQVALDCLQQRPPKFYPLKEYSLSFTALSKRLCTLYLLHLQQYPLNSILYINSVLDLTFYIIFYYSSPRERTDTKSI
jgi:hypothetical protein